MASRSLDDLAPVVKARALALVAECRACGIDLLIYCTLRGCDEQRALYRVGRDLPGKILTCAKPGESLHNPDKHGKAWAFDAVPMLFGRPAWENVQLIKSMGDCGESVGLEWAGNWRGEMREALHFQVRQGCG